jgi:hypothetical protein
MAKNLAPFKTLKIHAQLPIATTADNHWMSYSCAGSLFALNFKKHASSIGA